MKQEQKRRGRPSKKPVAGERNALGLRVTAELKQRLEDAAAAAGRSQSQEAEARLERSFETADVVTRHDDLQHGRDVVGFLMLAEEIMTSAGRLAAMEQGKRDRSWVTDPYAYDQAVKAFMDVAEHLRPPGDIPPNGTVIELPTGSRSKLKGNTGRIAARLALAGIAQAGKANAEPDLWTKAIRDRIGPLVDDALARKAPRKDKKQ